MPKPSGRIDEKQRQIAQRVRQVRYANQLSQPAFARALGISLDRAAGIEYARTPLTAGVADKISAVFDVSLMWLAEGRGRMNPCIGLISIVSPQTRPSSLFSKVCSPDLFRRFRDEGFFRMFSAAAIMTGDAGLPKGEKTELLAEHLHHAFEEELQELPHAGKEKLLNLLIRTLAKFSLDWELGRREKPGERTGGGSGPPVESAAQENQSLTDSASASKVASVKLELQLPGLLERLRKATAQAGKKSELAAFLQRVTKANVPLASVSRWLSGEREPGGEVALLLLRWVELQERGK